MNTNDLKTFDVTAYGPVPAPGKNLLDDSLLKNVQIVDTYSGEPLVGAHIYVNGKEKYSTGQNGNVTIIAQSQNDKITISHVAYGSRDFVFKNLGSMINLDPQAMTQNPVVVDGAKLDSKVNWLKWAGIGIAGLVVFSMMNQDKPKKVTV